MADKEGLNEADTLGVTDVAANEARAEKMIRVFASSIDAALQEWLAKGRDDDRLGTVISSMRVAQAGAMMSQYFQDIAERFIHGPTEIRAANEASANMAVILKGLLGEALGLEVVPEKEETPVTCPDRNMN